MVEYLLKQMMATIEYESTDPDSPLANCHVRCEVKLGGLKDNRKS